jgi:hypothetical protein
LGRGGLIELNFSEFPRRRKNRYELESIVIVHGMLLVSSDPLTRPSRILKPPPLSPSGGERVNDPTGRGDGDEGASSIL